MSIDSSASSLRAPRLGRAALQSLRGVVYTSNAFIFNQFRTLCAQWTNRNPFAINSFRTLFHVMVGGVSAARLSAICLCILLANLPLCFQSVARCPSRNSFLFTLLHCCRGVARG